MYGHEYSVNEQRGPIVYNQSKHETMGNMHKQRNTSCRKPSNPNVSIPYKGGLCDATGHLPGYIAQIVDQVPQIAAEKASEHSAQGEWEKKRQGRIYLYEWGSL